MKRPYKYLFILTILLATTKIVNAQTEGYVSPPSWVYDKANWKYIEGVTINADGTYDQKKFDDNNDIIFKTIQGDVASRVALGDNDKTVYILRRNQVYTATSLIYFESLKHICIMGEPGTGELPLILHKRVNNQGANFLRAHQNVYFIDFEWDGRNANNSFQNRAIDFRGPNTQIICKGLRLVNDRAGSLCIESGGNGIKLYVYDCLMGNSGHWVSYGGNGRALDIRVDNNNGLVDSIVFKNCTMYNLTDRVVRSMGGITNYMEFDHCTFINNQGRHGGIQLGNTREAVITNNVFANPLIYGDRLGDAQFRDEQNQAAIGSADRAFAIVTFNGTFSRLWEDDRPENYSGRDPIHTNIIGMTMRNNNIFFKQEFLDFFKAHPNFFGQWSYAENSDANKFNTPDGVRLGSDAFEKYFIGDKKKAFFKEELAYDYNDHEAGHLGAVSSYKDLVKVLEAFYENPNRNDLPENWSRIFPVEWDAKYPTSAKSYSAADGGFPLGDLNWFPSDKAAWMTNPIAKSSVTKSIVAEIPIGIEIERAYPNPFISDAKIDYKLFNDQVVEISIYNYLGQKVKILKTGNMKQGDYQINWDGSDNNGNAQPNGVYHFVIKGTSGRVSAKLLKN